MRRASGDEPPAPPSQPQPLTGALVAPSSGGGAPAVGGPITLERSLFTSTSFAPPLLAEGICKQVLSHVPLIALTDGNRYPGSTFTLSATSQAASFSSGGTNLAVDHDVSQDEYCAIAADLHATLQHAQQDLSNLMEGEELRVLRAEAEARHVESTKKSLLNKVRSGLDSTTQRMRQFENSIANAVMSTVGIEQHLTQSNNRVTRGKSVGTLLKYFTMLTSMESKDLLSILGNLSKARREQRERVTSFWESGEVSAVNPRYFTLTRAAMAEGAGGSPGGGGSSKNRGKRSGGDQDSDDGAHVDDNGDDERAAGRNASGGELGSDDDDDDESEDATGDVSATKKVPLHRAELAAVAQGLDRLFAARYYTEAQVQWVLRLTVLSKELSDVVGKAGNVNLYLQWLKQELREDCNHLVKAFRSFYDTSATAVHQPYGKAILKTLEVVGRLYGQLCVGRKDDPSALLEVFIEESLTATDNDLRASHCPKPVPPQPPIVESTMTSLMNHFSTLVKHDIEGAGEFLTQRTLRETILVEALVASGLGVGSSVGGGGSNADGGGGGGGGAADSLQAAAAAAMSSSSPLGGSAASGHHFVSNHLASAAQARQQLFIKTLDPVLKTYAALASGPAEQILRDAMSQEAVLTPRSKRRVSGRLAEAIAYSHSVTAELFALCSRVVQFLEDEFGAHEAAYLRDKLPLIFPSQVAYVTDRQEVELLKRYYAQMDEQYMRPLLPPVGDPFDVVPEHSKKANEITSRLQEVVRRVCVMAPPADLGAYVSDLVTLAVDSMGRYLKTECDKMLQAVKADRGNWTKERREEDWINPSSKEIHLCAMRMILFVQSALVSLLDMLAHMTVERVLAPWTAAALSDLTARPDYAAIDEIVEDLMNYIAASMVAKSLSILYYAQKRHDFMPTEKKAAAGTTPAAATGGGTEILGTRACSMFCQYVSHQLQLLTPLLQVSCGQLWRRDTDNEQQMGGGGGGSSGAGGSPSLGAQTGSKTASTTGAQPQQQTTQAQDRSMTTLRSRADALRKVQRMSLQQLLFGDGGPGSLVRAIGVPLYRGIAAHVRAFRVNEGGKLVYMQDMGKYRLVVKPLVDVPGLDGMIVERLFALLKETSGLLFAAIENIAAVKRSGLLNELMSNDEKVSYLKMREDLREGFNA